ncbi:unnamed protein product [Adineta steineri]|uniref:t-SNARE coiled-coil homology domain-containing protein n=1 Tax=Adineta steineri TaxID=433720 RepID=A0A813ZW18_9BILA|nr:unnamed protein product [Adineta steineri]CAF0938763.1 unnamed protein product [Adineta steineri]
MSTTIDTFIYLKRDIEQSFQRVQAISNSSQYDQQELDQLFNHISCTLDDLQKINQSVNIPLPDLSENENDSEGENTEFISQKHFTVSYSKDSNINNGTTYEEREDFIRRMKTELTYYKSKIQPTKKENQMEIIRLDQAPEEEDDDDGHEDHIIRKQDQQLEDMHHSIVSLKNLTKNINFEINDHINILDTLETDMVNSHNHIENLTNRTKNFIRTSAGGVGGHTCLFAVAIGLFFLIIILILFF